MPLEMYKETPSPSKTTTSFTTVAVAAGKGGVGKSTITVNLARSLTLKGYKVGILDADLYGPSMRQMLPEQKMPLQKGDILYPALCEGIRMLSIAYFLRQGEASIVRAPIANGMITQFLQEIEWGPIDYLLIDFPPGTGDIQLTLSQKGMLSGAVMVSTPQQVAQLDVKKAIELFHQVQIPILGIVENFSGYQVPGSDEIHHIFGQGAGKQFAEECGLPFLGTVPIDPELSLSSDKGTSIFKTKQETPTIQAFQAITEHVLEQLKLIKENHESCLPFNLVWREMSNASKK